MDEDDKLPIMWTNHDPKTAKKLTNIKVEIDRGETMITQETLDKLKRTAEGIIEASNNPTVLAQAGTILILAKELEICVRNIQDHEKTKEVIDSVIKNLVMEDGTVLVDEHLVKTVVEKLKTL